MYLLKYAFSVVLLSVSACGTAVSLDGQSIVSAFLESRQRSRYSSSTVSSETAAGWVDKSKVEAVELSRFITGYRSRLDTLVDVTPYTPMFKSAYGKPVKFLDFYGFISTYVSNNTMSNMAYMNNVTKQCSPITHSDGNGWDLNVDLVFTPRKKAKHAHPRKVVTVFSGGVFDNVRLGAVTVHDARFDGHTLFGPEVEDGNAKSSEEAKKFEDDIRTANNATIFRCDGGIAAIFRDTKLHHGARSLAEARGDSEALKRIERDVFKGALETQDVKTLRQGKSPHEVFVSFDPFKAKLSPGLPIFYNDVLTDGYLAQDHVWWNLSAPFEQMGEVVSVDNDTAVVHLSSPCLPNAASNWEPRIKVARSREDFEKAQQFMKEAKELAKTGGARTTNTKSGIEGLGLVENIIGHVDYAEPWLIDKDGPRYPVVFEKKQAIDKRKEEFVGKQDKATRMQAGSLQKVCVITQHAHGRLVDQEFRLPKIGHGERVIAHFVSTGHGWESTEEGCGEYCKTKYHLAFDGGKPSDFMQWRDDCKDNPTGNSQYGTWWESRNGWCPGAVSPGVYIDITDSLNLQRPNTGVHRVTLDISVMSSRNNKYEPFTNLQGWLKRDGAQLNMDLKVFIYPAEVVQQMQQPGRRTCSGAHSTLKRSRVDRTYVNGATWPVGTPHNNESLDEPSHKSENNLLRRSSRKHDMLSVDDPESESNADVGECAIDFEAMFPWYTYHAQEEPLASGATWVNIMSHRLVQNGAQFQRARIDTSKFPKHWGQVGLRVHVGKPAGLDTDHWDRIASVGILLPNAGKPVVPPAKQYTPMPTEPPKPRQASTTWSFMMEHVSVQSIAVLGSMVFTLLVVIWSSSCTSRTKDNRSI